MLPVFCPVHLIARPFHQQKEIFFTAAFLHGFGDLEHQLELPALAFLRSPVLPGGEFLTALLVRLQYGQVMIKAYFITQFPELLQGGGILPELLPGFVCHSVDDEVRMDVSSITVGSDLNLMTGPSLLRKLNCDFVSLRWCQLFPRREGLNVLIEVDSVQLSVRSFCSEEFCNCISAITVDTADQMPLGLLIPNLFRLHAVAHHGFHGTHRLGAFLDVGHGRHLSPPPMRQSCS